MHASTSECAAAKPRTWRAVIAVAWLLLVYGCFLRQYVEGIAEKIRQ